MLVNWGAGELLRVPWTTRRSKQSILKEIIPEYSLAELMLKRQYFGYLMWCPRSFTLVWLISPGLLPTISTLRLFPNELALQIRCPKYWHFNFSISPSSEYSGLISFRIDQFDLLAAQGTLKFSPTPQFESINSLTLSLIYGPIVTSVHDYWKNHSFG